MNSFPFANNEEQKPDWPAHGLHCSNARYIEILKPCRIYMHMAKTDVSKAHAVCVILSNIACDFSPLKDPHVLFKVIYDV